MFTRQYNMKRTLIILIMLIFIISICLIIINRISENNYSLKEIKNLLNPKITNNMSIRHDFTYIKSEIEDRYTDTILLKDKKAYECQNMSSTGIIREFIFDIENGTQLNINHNDKSIRCYLNENLNDSIILNVLELYNVILNDTNNFEEYKYYGKEKIDGKKYIKFSVIVNSNYFYDINNKVKLYYYISEQEQAISKVEQYSITGDKEELLGTSVLTYSYDIVTDEDIPKFDINNYSDYSYMEYIN